MPGCSRPVQLLIVAALCVFGGLMHSQTSPSTASQSPENSAKTPFTLKTATHLVLIDVIATDGKGRPMKKARTSAPCQRELLGRSIFQQW